MTKPSDTDAYLTSYELSQMQNRMTALMEAADWEEDAEQRDAYLAEAEALYDELEGSVPEKLLKLRAVLLRLQAECNMIRLEEKSLARARRSRERGAKRLKDWMRALVEGHQQTHGEGPVKKAGRSFWLVASRRLVVDLPEDEWPKRWKRTTVAFDKAAAKMALEHASDRTRRRWANRGVRIVEELGVRFK